MKFWVPPLASALVGLVIGMIVFTKLGWHLTADYAPYLSVAALAGLDTVFGGVRAGIEGRFQNDIFATGFLLNTVMAGLLAALGDRIGVNLALVAVLVMGSRVFLNLSLIRRYVLNKRAMERSKQLEESAAAVSGASAALNQKTETGSSL
jgi:small basic protein